MDSAGSIRGGGQHRIRELDNAGVQTVRYGTQGIDEAEEVHDTLQCKQSVVTDGNR